MLWTMLLLIGALVVVLHGILPLWHVLWRVFLEGSVQWGRLLGGDSKGAWALVTGASMGMGKEYALQLAQRGFNVVMIADPATAAQLEEVARTIAASSGGYRKVLAISEDLLDPAAYDRIAVAIQAIAPDISVLVNNVGMCVLDRFTHSPTEAEVKMLRLNTIPMVRFTKLLLPHMQARRRGLIINVSSISGIVPSAFLSVYAGTKRFVLGFTDSLRAELDRSKHGGKIHVLAVTAFSVRTALWKSIDDQSDTTKKVNNPVLVEAKDAVEAVLNRSAAATRRASLWGWGSGGGNGSAAVMGHPRHEWVGWVISLIPRQPLIDGFSQQLVKCLPETHRYSD